MTCKLEYQAKILYYNFVSDFCFRRQANGWQKGREYGVFVT